MAVPVPPPEFTRPVDWRASGKQRISLKIKANSEECAALARRLGVLGIDALEAELAIAVPPGGDGLRLSGRLRATVRQSCGVTLAPVEERIDEDFSVLYAPAADDAAASDADLNSEDSWDEPWPGDTLDAGEAVAQQLALAINPYPRAPGAALPDGASDGDGDVPARPLSGLSAKPPKGRGRA